MFSGRLRVAALVCLLAALASTNAFAQGSTTTALSGVVIDAAGGAIPGATVVVKNNATSVSQETVSNGTGQFSFPVLDAGTYTVTVSLSGFKTFVANEVRLLAARPGEVTAKLEIGALTETVEVKAGTELVQTQTTAVAATLSVEQLSELPLVSRNSLYAVALLPGVATTGGPRGAVINGLPNNTVNITIDGINTGNMLQSTDGFFSMVTPRMDAVEEITVTGAVPGAGGGAGSVQVGFVTRSGTNKYDGSVYHYYRSPQFNSNYYFNEINNLAKNEVIVHQFGGRIGGPIVIPGVYDGRGKAFFFHNFEEQYQPQSVTRTRTMLRDSALSGVFGYNVGTTRREINLMQLAAANGQSTTFDPTVIAMLNRIRSAAASQGTINDTGAGSTLEYVFQSGGQGKQFAPTTRVDFNLSPRHRLSGAYWLQRFTSTSDILNNRDPIFPGLPNNASQNSWRTTGNASLRSTLTTNLVNEVKGGWQWSPNDFFANVTADQFTTTDGLDIRFPGNTSSQYYHTSDPAPRNTTTWSVEDTLNWLRGRHSITMGGSYAGILNRQNGYNVVPQVQLGFDTNTDPAASMFTTANFPGASSTNLTEARNLYALLTGRVSSLPGTARLDANGQYVYGGDLAQKSSQTLFSAYFQDSWRIKPTLTVNGGLRWDLQLPFTPASNAFSTATMEDLCGISGVGSSLDGRGCNIFQPGVQPGKAVPTYTRFEEGQKAFNTQWHNFAPNLGVAWRPNVQDGFLKTLLGDPDQATLRAGYSISFNQERIERFTVNAGDNPGGAISVTRNLTTGYPLITPGTTAPVFLSQRDRLGPPTFPTEPVYPIVSTTANNVNLFQADLQTPRVHSYSVGLQRSLGEDMAFEVRYVGNRNLHTWAEENWNERNIIENGFLDEFKLAQANLKANIAAGKGNTFAYTGAPGTSPLPIHLAYINGSANAANAAAYSGATWTDSAFLGRLSTIEPDPLGEVAAIDTSARRALALQAGLPSNFIVMNPAVGGTFIVQDRNYTQFNSMQLELRRRLSRGLLVSANYTYGIRKTSVNRSIRFDRLTVDNTDVPHAYKVNWVWEVPVGQGRRFGTDMNRVLDAALGGWQFSGNARFQQQRYQMTGVQIVGMTRDELQDAFKIRIVRNDATQLTQVFSFPQDIIDNTRAAFNSDPTSATGYSTALGVPTGRYIAPASTPGCIAIYRGDCGAEDINLNGPLFTRVDLTIKKQFRIVGRVTGEISFDVYNAFDNINFNHSVANNPNTSTDTFRVTSAYTDINTTFDPGGRIGQLMWRVTW